MRGPGSLDVACPTWTTSPLRLCTIPGLNKAYTLLSDAPPKGRSESSQDEGGTSPDNRRPGSAANGTGSKLVSFLFPEKKKVGAPAIRIFMQVGDASRGDPKRVALLALIQAAPPTTPLTASQGVERP